MVTRLIGKGANVIATDRDGRDALDYLQLSVQQHPQSDRYFHESGREILFVLQKARANMEIAQHRQALRHQQQQTSLSQYTSSASATSSGASASASASAQSYDAEGGNDSESGSGEGVGDDYVVDIYCRDTMDMDNMGSSEFSDALGAEGQGLGLGTGLGLGSGPALGQGLAQGQGLDQGSGLGRTGPRQGLSADDLVHLSATATVVQIDGLHIDGVSGQVELMFEYDSDWSDLVSH